MRNWCRIAIVFLLWIVNLFTGTGLDNVYHVTQYGRWLVLAITVVVIILKGIQMHKIPVYRKDVFIFGGMAAFFILSSALHGFGMQPIQYLWVFLLVLFLSKLSFTEKDFFWIGLFYGAAGFVVLLLFSQSRVFDGWNENSIAMIGVFSYLVMLVPLYKNRSRWSKVLIIALTVLFAYYVNPTNSRASILFMTVGVIFALGFIKRDLITKKGVRLTVFLFVPFLIALIAILVSNGAYMKNLNEWSNLHFGKPFFNGRDVLWKNGLSLFGSHFIVGTGSMLMGNWHNSAISALVAFGGVGYLFWLASMHDILRRAYPYMQDYLVQGCFVGFILIYFQQSMELGFFSTKPTLIPYVLLGLMLGRIRYLKTEMGENNETKRDRTSV